MRLLGLEITRARKAAPSGLSAPSDRGWYPLIRESYTGAWQRNVTLTRESVLTFSALHACVTLIASDIGKLPLRLVEFDKNGIWKEADNNAAFSPVLRRPNRYQNTVQFIQWWVTSKLIHGNTYVLKVRDARGVVTGLYILDPLRTKVLVAPDGSVFYQLSTDNLSGLSETNITVPASEIIHDVMSPLYHPLCGVSPISACGLAAAQGLSIQTNSTKFFGNNARPGGLLIAPDNIPDDAAQRLKEYWESSFTGENAGRLAVLGNGMKYESMSVNPDDAQLIEQLKWTAEEVCRPFHVPPYKIGIGQMPSYNNVQSLNVEYYSQCLQILIKSIEDCLDEGLGIGQGNPKEGGKVYGTEFDLDALLWMDSVTQMDVLDKAKNILTPDEQRKKLNCGPTEGGNVVYRQQQDYSLAALAKRDAKEDPFGKAAGDTPKPADNSVDGADPAASNDNPAQSAANARTLLAYAHKRVAEHARS